MTQGGEELVLCAICRFGSIAGGGKLSGIFHTIGHVADGELEDFGFLLNVQIAGQFHMTELTCIGRDLHIHHCGKLPFRTIGPISIQRREMSGESNVADDDEWCAGSLWKIVNIG
jgi:hypothetical protein